VLGYAVHGDDGNVSGDGGEGVEPGPAVGEEAVDLVADEGESVLPGYVGYGLEGLLVV